MMTNYNFNGCNYFYTILEAGNKGYILKEEFLPPKFEVEQQQRQVFFDFGKQIGEKLCKGYSIQELLDEIGYISVYGIISHKEAIKPHTQGLCTVLGSSNDMNGENTLYFILTIKKMEDFSQVPRYDISRKAIFLNEIKDSEGNEISGEYYLN